MASVARLSCSRPRDQALPRPSIAGWLRRATLVTAAGMAGATAASAGALPGDTWLEFSFGDVGSQAIGCDPADPAGGFCIPSSGTPTQFLDAPAWTFTAGAGGSVLTVTDAFSAGDRFEIFDFGVSLGLTSVPAAAALVDCGDDPAVCVGTAGISQGQFNLAAGAHSLTLQVAATPDGLGAGYLFVSNAGTNTVPAPGALPLVALAALLALAAARVAPRGAATRGRS